MAAIILTKSSRPEFNLITLLFLDIAESFFANDLFDHGLDSSAHSGSSTNKELTVLFHQYLFDKFTVF